MVAILIVLLLFAILAGMSGVEGRLKTSTGETLVYLWEITEDPHLAENTNGTTGGICTDEPVKIRNTIEADIYLGSDSLGQAQDFRDIGLTPGALVFPRLRIGTSPKGLGDGSTTFASRVGVCRTTGNDANGLARGHVTLHPQVARPAPSNYP